ncbi:hypothetical protein [Thalassobacillus sp. B23F22_16]|uniref:hypothetical protein n=1 Tax=Thalassobacillus sp. B23F22_16 TaxID=3459513 RepID=UPI00373F406E
MSEVVRYFNEDWEKVRPEFNELSSVKEVFACFVHKDAMLKGYYETEEVSHNHKLKKIINVPRLVVRNENGDEFWRDDYNAGYGGYGPSNTVRLLKSIGIDLEDAIKQNRQVYYNVPDDQLEVSGTKFDVVESQQYDLPGVDFYQNPDNKIVAIPSMIGYMDTLSHLEGFTAYYSQRILDEIDAVYLYLERGQAISRGNYLVEEGDSIQEEKIFPICIQGKNGHELWLDMKREIDKYNPFEDYRVEMILSAIDFSDFKEEEKSFVTKLKDLFSSYDPLTLKLTKVDGKVHVENIDVTKVYT